MCQTVSVTCACFFAGAHRDVPSHCHTVRAGSWWGGGVLPGGCYLPRWSPSQSSNLAQSCRAKRSRPRAWWLRSLLSPPSLTLKEEDREYKAERNTELQRLKQKTITSLLLQFISKYWAKWLQRELICLLVRSSRSWHLRSKYSVHWDNNLGGKKQHQHKSVYLSFSHVYLQCFMLNYLWLTPLMTDVGLHSGSWAVRTTWRRNKLGFWMSGKAEVSDWLRV